MFPLTTQWLLCPSVSPHPPLPTCAVKHVKVNEKQDPVRLTVVAHDKGKIRELKGL